MPLTINEIRSLGDPQRSYKWEVVMPTIKTVKETANLSRNLFSGISTLKSLQAGRRDSLGTLGGVVNRVSASNNPSLLVEEVQGVPFTRIDSEAFYEGGSNTYFPGLVDIDRVSIVFYQNESNSIPEYIQSWKELIVNSNGTKNLPDEYKNPILIKLLNGRNVPVLAYRLLGAFPTATTPYTLDNSSERLNFIQEFSVDSAEYVDISLLESLGGSVLQTIAPGTLAAVGQDKLAGEVNRIGAKRLLGTDSFLLK